jgi:hypothetical protein
LIGLAGLDRDQPTELLDPTEVVALQLDRR